MALEDDPKKGHICCGGCCDMRRAVIIVNITSIIAALFGMILILSTSRSVASTFTGSDDEEVIEEYKSVQRTGVILTAVGIACAAIGIWGSKNFNVLGVSISALFLVAAFIAETVLTLQLYDYVEEKFDVEFDNNAVNGNIAISAVGTLLYVYPHVGLIIELRNGIMTPETYPREEMSCCCVYKSSSC